MAPIAVMMSNGYVVARASVWSVLFVAIVGAACDQPAPQPSSTLDPPGSGRGTSGAPTPTNPPLTSEQILTINDRLQQEPPLAAIPGRWTAAEHTSVVFQDPPDSTLMQGAAVEITIDPPADLEWESEPIVCMGNGELRRARVHTQIAAASQLTALVRLDDEPIRIRPSRAYTPPPSAQQYFEPAQTYFETVLEPVGPPRGAQCGED